MNKELQVERDKLKFNLEEFTNWFYGGADNVKKKRFLENYFCSDPELTNDRVDCSYLSHKEKYEEAIRKFSVVLKKIKTLENQYGNEIYNEIFLSHSIRQIFKEGNPASVHFDMFVPSLRGFGTEQQKNEWLPRALSCKILGTYAQTELGHGTFLKGLECTARYDERTQEFVINSPTLSSYKFWPGNLGQTTNYALVMAQLYTQGRNCGIQPFIVQLRDEDTHKPMPGIIIGEIGTKVGFNTVNNGYLAFDNVRIPRKNMLMKNCEVRENGDFIKHKDPVLNYSTMTLVRVGIIENNTLLLANAVTIAVRYSMVRRQSPIEEYKDEPKIIEHLTQQKKVFPAIARVLVFKLTASSLSRMYREVTEQIENGNLNHLPELHALSCCLKAVCTDETAMSAEICRLACGGHGYLNSAGFSDIYKTITPAQTYEGENTVLFLQTARYLIKTWEQLLNGGKVSSTVAYLKHHVDRNGNRIEAFDSSPRGTLIALQNATASKVAHVYKKYQEKKKILSPGEAANECGLEFVKIGYLHAKVFILQTAVSELEKASKTCSPTLSYIYRDILELYSIDVAKECMGTLLQFIKMSPASAEKMQRRLEAVLKRIRQYAIGIVDSFDIPDSILNSTLGSYDGNVYERLFGATKKSPLNQEDVNESFEKYLKPFMKSSL